jgi:hypothetical protein
MREQSQIYREYRQEKFVKYFLKTCKGLVEYPKEAEDNSISEGKMPLSDEKGILFD